MPTAHREEALFAAVLEKPSDERAAYLQGACGGDHALRQRIESLLAAHDACGGVLDSPPPAPAPTTA